MRAALAASPQRRCQLTITFDSPQLLSFHDALFSIQGRKAHIWLRLIPHRQGARTGRSINSKGALLRVSLQATTTGSGCAVMHQLENYNLCTSFLIGSTYIPQILAKAHQMRATPRTELCSIFESPLSRLTLDYQIKFEFAG